MEKKSFSHKLASDLRVNGESLRSQIALKAKKFNEF